MPTVKTLSGYLNLFLPLWWARMPTLRALFVTVSQRLTYKSNYRGQISVAEKKNAISIFAFSKLSEPCTALASID